MLPHAEYHLLCMLLGGRRLKTCLWPPSKEHEEKHGVFRRIGAGSCCHAEDIYLPRYFPKPNEADWIFNWYLPTGVVFLHIGS